MCGGGGGGGGGQKGASHSNLEVLDKVCLVLLGSDDDGLVGDVGQGDLVLATAVLGRLLTHHKDEQLYGVCVCVGGGGGGGGGGGVRRGSERMPGGKGRVEGGGGGWRMKGVSRRRNL